MAGEPLNIFDPRRNFQLQGFANRAATTTLHDATATGVSISGIFQSAEDFAVLEWFNAYDYYNHLRCRPLPRFDLTGVTLAFTLEMDHVLDGAVRIGSPKYPSVSWDAMVFYLGAAMTPWLVKLTDYAEVLSGSLTPSTAASGADYLNYIDGTLQTGDYLLVSFRNYRYAIQVGAGLDTVDLILTAVATAINGETATTGLSAVAMGQNISFQFNGWGKDGNGDALYFSSYGAQTEYWHIPRMVFQGGDDDRVYRITIPMDTVEGAQVVGGATSHFDVTDIRKIATTYAPRFENIELGLGDGCFLTAGVTAADTTWSIDNGDVLTGGRYVIGDTTNEERVLLVAGGSSSIDVQRGYEGSTARAWPSGTRMKKISPVTGFTSDVEWRAVISDIAVTGDTALKVGGDSTRIEEADSRCKYTGYWEDYKYGVVGWPSQWWSSGHAKRTGPNNAGDVRKVSLRYSYQATHDLYVGTFLYTNCGKISVSVDGVATTHDLYLNQYNGTTATVKVRGSVPAGTHVVEITALFDKNTASTGYYFYFDYLWPLEPQDVPDAPQQYTDVSLALDFDTDHGYKKPPAWQLWQLQKLGFAGHADLYMGVFWNNKRRRVGATYPSCAITFGGDSTTLGLLDVVTINLAGTPVSIAPSSGVTLQDFCNRFRETFNGMFPGVWCDNNYGTSTTLRICVKGPVVHVLDYGGKRPRPDSYAHAGDASARRGWRDRRLGDSRFGVASDDRRRAAVDSRYRWRVSGGGHPGVVRVLDGGLQPAGRDAREIPVVHRRRGCARRGCVPRRALVPDALRHARPRIPEADVQGMRRPDRGGGRAGDSAIRRDAVVVLRQQGAGPERRDALL